MAVEHALGNNITGCNVYFNDLIIVSKDLLI